MNCPKCVGIMKEILIPADTPFTVDRCPMCGGMWFDKDELSRMLDAQIFADTRFRLELDAPVDEALAEQIGLDKKEIDCPRCGNGQRLSRAASPRRSEVMIDFCERCSGIWLDRGEYDKLSEHSLVENAIEEFLGFLRSHFHHNASPR